MSGPLRVDSFTFFDETPSSRVRIRQYASSLAAQDIQLTDHGRGPSRWLLDRIHGRVTRPRIGCAALQQLDAFLGYGRIPRERIRGSILWLLKYYFPFRLLDLPNPKVLDIDDAIWLTTPGFSRLLRRVQAVTAGNSFIAEWARKHNEHVDVVPTTIDTDHFRNDHPFPDDFVIAWTGLSANLRYLEPLEEKLASFMERHSDTRLRVICDRPPRFLRIPPDRLSFVRWDPSTEVDGLKDISVGLMPIPDSDWARGKCAFKMLQYMAMERPAIVSPVGANSEVLAKGPCGLPAAVPSDWLDALEYYYSNPAEARLAGRVGRRIVEQEFSVAAGSVRLSALFRSLQ